MLIKTDLTIYVEYAYIFSVTLLETTLELSVFELKKSGNRSRPGPEGKL